MYIGAAYYPELWDEQEIDKDIEKCRAMGINCLRVGEFAWGVTEPREGEFDFGWLKRVVDKLTAASIAVVLCTPTCTPPRWLLDKYPEVRTVSQNGRRQTVSSRCHICKTSPLIREKNREMITRLAKEFGKHPGVVAWQIDNELFPYDGGCYCDACVEAFRDYLKTKYKTVDELNRLWGMTRWSLEYPSFAHIQPPRDDEWVHPSLRTEWRTFGGRQIASYINEQAELLHRYSKAPVGTDMMPVNTLGYYETTKQLDVIMHNHYNTAEQLPNTVFDYNFLRPIKPRPFWVTETQVGWYGSECAEGGSRPVNNCYINTWLPLIMGAEANLYWLFRTPQTGHELAHGALYSTAGRVYRVSLEARRVAREIAKCAPVLEHSRIRSTVAMHYCAVSERNFKSAPIVKNFSYKKTLWAIHAAFRHVNIDVIDTPHSLEGYTTLLSPFVTTLTAQEKARILEWVKAGGKWIVGPMTDIMTDYTAKCAEAPFFDLERLAGVYTEYQRPVPNDSFKAAWENGDSLGVSLCYDAFIPNGGTEVLAEYDAGEFCGYAVVTRRTLGKGCIIMVGSMLSEEGWKRLADPTPILRRASKNIQLVKRTGEIEAILAVELENREGYLFLEEAYTDLISGETLQGQVPVKPYSVLVLVKAQKNKKETQA